MQPEREIQSQDGESCRRGQVFSPGTWWTGRRSLCCRFARVNGCGASMTNWPHRGHPSIPRKETRQQTVGTINSDWSLIRHRHVNSCEVPRPIGKVSRVRRLHLFRSLPPEVRDAINLSVILRDAPSTGRNILLFYFEALRGSSLAKNAKDHFEFM